MLLQQVGRYHKVPIFISYRKDPEETVGTSAQYGITSTVRFLNPKGELCIGVVNQANIARLKVIQSSNCWPSCVDIARHGDADDCDSGE